VIGDATVSGDFVAGSNLLRTRNSTSRVGVNTATPGYTLDVNGDANVRTGFVYRINGTSVLSATTLGSGVTASSLTSVGSSLSINGNTALHTGNYGSYSTFGGKVISGGNNGFANDVYYVGVRNPIWSFGNASSYGISYYQGAAGIGGVDTIGFSVNGTTSATSNNFAIAPGASYVNNNVILHAGNYTSYSPSLTGSGASGTWGISISGNAGTVTNGVYLSGTQAITGVKEFNVPAGATYGGASGNNVLTVYQPTAGADAMMTFHVGGDWAGYFGLGGAENDLVWTGWSVGYSRWRILHSGNYSSYALPLSGGTLTGNLTFAQSSNRVIQYGSASNWAYYLASEGDNFRLYDAQNTTFLHAVYNGGGPAKYTELNGTLRVTTGGSATVGGNTILNAGNYTSYVNYGAPNLRGTYQISNWNQTTYPNSHFLSSESGTTNAPTGDYTYGIQYCFHRDGASYRTQMVTSLYSDLNIWVRNSRDSDVFTSWKALLHSGNYTSYAPSLTGSGASGTWAINVTGSAGSVAWSNVSSKPTDIMYYAGNTLDANTMPANSTGFTYVSNAPYYGPIVRFSSWPSSSGAYDLWLNAAYSGGGNQLSFRTRNGDNSTFNPWKSILHDGNYSSYALPLSGGTLTGNVNSSGNITANAFLLNGGFTISASGAYGAVNNWIQLNGTYGLYAPSNNNAHFYPNDADYGSWRIAGTRNGWYGIYFDSGSTLMMNSSEVGFHRSGYGWQMRWMAGTGYVHKGNPGGGTEATILDSSNYSSYALPLSGGTVTGVTYFLGNMGSGVYSGNTANARLQAFSNDGGTAMMSFHRANAYAVNMGLDPDNVLRIGGWSASANRWQLDMSGNMTVAGSSTASNTMYSYNWFRSYNATGWYNETYGGGIWMSDYTWVRVYGTKDFYATAAIAAVGNITAYYSDERLKTKVGDIDNALAKVRKLSGFLYVENELARKVGYKNTKQQVGVSAQRVREVLPEAVSLAPFDIETDRETGELLSKSGEEYLTVDYSRLVPLLIEAVKELADMVEGRH
jgi:hypothetical protein